ncbi:caspase family protein [uncultured Desulfobacter sp.]|uniref:caspase family protein n=1 Tax=uncultured Desulfobacter sp. TaxID=240139 RepID=UPI002AAAD317|nr:caspase family protein [uncultured Desulfobacter sp.]
MKPTAKVVVELGFFVLIVAAAATGYASQHNARAVKIISNLNHSCGHIGTYHALLIGINDYKDPGIPDLETPVNDVHEMTALLKEKYGFKVSRLIDGKVSKKGIFNR